MKKILVATLIATMLVGCGEPLTVGNKTYPTYGLFNENSSKSDKMCYEVSVGNVVWSIIGIENIIMPVYFVGFSIYNPIGLKDAAGKCGINQTR